MIRRQATHQPRIEQITRHNALSRHLDTNALQIFYNWYDHPSQLTFRWPLTEYFHSLFISRRS